MAERRSCSAPALLALALALALAFAFAFAPATPDGESLEKAKESRNGLSSTALVGGARAVTEGL